MHRSSPSTRPPLSAALVVLLTLAGPLAAQRAPRTGEALSVHPEAREAIAGLKSPYCPGMMLEVCPSPGGAMLRDSIQARAERGMGAEAIIDGVVAEYGEEWRAEPPARGAGLWAWLLPPAALLVGVGLVAALLAGRARRAGPSLSPDRPDPEDEDRLREALRRLDEEEEPVF